MLMKCIGFSTLAIVSYFLGIIVLTLLVVNKVVSWIPASAFGGCTINGRKGTPDECGRVEWVVRAILRGVLTLAVFHAVHSVFRLGLQFEVYDTAFFFGNLLVRKAL